jgi:hypothetical protein
MPPAQRLPNREVKAQEHVEACLVLLPNDCMLCLQQAAPELARNIRVPILSGATPLHSSLFFFTHTPYSLSSVFGLLGCAATCSNASTRSRT